MLYYVLRPIFWLLFRAIFAFLGGLCIEGRERVPKRGPLIVAPNHISFADPALIGLALGRPAWFMATDEMFAMPVLGKLAKIMRAYPVRQDSPDRAALRRTERLLKQGQAVVIFPEGHVSKTGGLQPIQPGVILLALRTGAPILPVGVMATDGMMPPHQWRLHRTGRPAVARFGVPLSVDQLTGGLSGRAAIDHGARMLSDALAALVDQPHCQATDESSPVVDAPPLAEGRNCRV